MKKPFSLLFLLAIAGLFPTRAPADDLARGLVAWYRFDGNLTDASGNGNHATVGAGSAAYAAGVYGQALSLDNSHFLSGTDLPPETGWTVTLWAKRTANGTHPSVDPLMGGNIDSDFGVFVVQSSGEVRARFLGSSSLELSLGNVLPLNGGFRFLSYVYDYHTDTVFAYLDGDLISSRVLPSKLPTVINMRFGRIADRTFTFIGQLDNFMIFNRALSPSEIRALYALGSPIGLAP